VRKDDCRLSIVDFGVRRLDGALARCRTEAAATALSFRDAQVSAHGGEAYFSSGKLAVRKVPPAAASSIANRQSAIDNVTEPACGRFFFNRQDLTTIHESTRNNTNVFRVASRGFLDRMFFCVRITRRYRPERVRTSTVLPHLTERYVQSPELNLNVTNNTLLLDSHLPNLKLEGAPVR